MTRTSHSDRARPDLPDARDTAWDQFLRTLDDLLLDNTFRRARPTLDGIRATVERTGRVTAAQRQAVATIVREFARWP